MSIIVKEIESSDRIARKAFVRFPINLYKDSPYYVPSLVLDEMGTLDPSMNPAFECCELQMFLAYRNGEIVGRIAAIINRASNKIWDNKNARFNFADFVDDKEVVDALFNAAFDWSRQKGMTHIVGPMGFTDLDGGGLLIEGYDRVATMATKYSFPYYREHVERLGFVKEVDWKEYLIQVPEVVPERHRRVANIVSDRLGLKVLKFRGLKQIMPYVDKIFHLLNKAYKPLYGFTELTEAQIERYVNMYVPLICWDLITIVIKEDTDQVVGFGMAIPNLSTGLQKSRGRLFPLGWLSLLKDLKNKKNDTIDLMLIGVDPEYQGKGVNAIIFNDIIPSARRCGFKYAESNPELEMNEKVASLWDGFNAENHKRRRAYIREL